MIGTYSHYIQAHRADGSQILGTLDGQNCLKCLNPLRTDAAIRLAKLPPRQLSLDGRAAEYRIVGVYSTRIVATLRKTEHGNDAWIQL